MTFDVLCLDRGKVGLCCKKCIAPDDTRGKVGKDQSQARVRVGTVGGHT